MPKRGRPLRADSASHPLALRLTAREMSRLVELGARWGLGSRSEVIREALRRCASMGAVHDVAFRLGQWAEEVTAGRRLGDEEVLLSKEEVAMAVDGVGVSGAYAILVPPLLNLLRTHVREHGWFFPPPTVRPEEARVALATGAQRLPSAFLRQRFPSFWFAGDGPAGWALDDPRFARLVASRAGFNRRRELFDVSFRRLRYGLQVERHVVSFFQPVWALRVYRDILGSTPKPVVWDPSAGFGARMLGFAAAFPKGVYFANEPASLTRRDLDALRADLHLAGETSPSGSEHANLPPESVDFVFTSPPYFDTERYFDEPGQSFREYPERDLWIERFVHPTVSNAASSLRRGALAAFNVSQDLESEFMLAAIVAGLKFVRRERLELKVHPFKAAHADVHEPILFFQK